MGTLGFSSQKGTWHCISKDGKSEERQTSLTVGSSWREKAGVK